MWSRPLEYRAAICILAFLHLECGSQYLSGFQAQGPYAAHICSGLLERLPFQKTKLFI